MNPWVERDGLVSIRVVFDGVFEVDGQTLVFITLTRLGVVDRVGVRLGLAVRVG